VPIAQLLLAVHAREGADYTGVALIRSSYRAFLERDTIRKTRLWHHDRFGAGTPVAIYPENAGDDVKDDIDDALENWRSGAKTYHGVPLRRDRSTSSAGRPPPDPARTTSSRRSPARSRRTRSRSSPSSGRRATPATGALGTTFAELLRQALQG
jgi:hypothetical protein